MSNLSGRTEFSAKTKAERFKMAKGRCEKCTAYLFSGKIHYDHVIPDALGGENTLGNCEVLCTNCHGAKTAKTDVPNISRAKRISRKHIGAVKKKAGGFPKSKFKKKVDGSVVLRDEN